MKKINSILILASLICIAISSCNKQSTDETNPNSDITYGDGSLYFEVISGSVNNSKPSVRSEVDASGTFTWTEGDNVAYHIVDGSAHNYLVTTSDGSGDNGKGAFNLNGAHTLASFICAWASTTAERDAFAVYPKGFVDVDAENYGQSGKALDMVFPSSYTYAECGVDMTPCPMISTNTAGVLAWDFKQVCGLLRIVVNNVPPGTDNISVSVAGKDMHGSFSIASPVTPGTSVVEAKDGSNSTISITGIPESEVYQDGITINLPLPVGAYDTDITVTCYDDATVKMIQTIPFAYSADRAHGKKLKMNLAAYTVNSSGLQVGFAPGNLQAKVSATKLAETVFTADEWRFASAQFEFLGQSGNSTLAEGDWVDLFCFVGAAAIYDNCGINKTGSKNADAFGNVANELLKTDWGAKVIGSYPANFWRTSTATDKNNGELNYVVFTRAASTIAGTDDARFAKGSVNGIVGLILFPDIYTHPDGVADPTNINNAAADYSGNNYSLSDWTKMEQRGCIFLPAAGHSSGTTPTIERYSGDTGTNMTGYYRINKGAAGKNADNAYRLAFTGGLDTSDPVINTNNQNRHEGMSVRLQRDLP